MGIPNVKVNRIGERNQMDLRAKMIENVILFFANKEANCTIERLKLMKLIWLSDRLHLNKYTRLIGQDRYKALPRGPIASETLTLSQSGVCGSFNVNDFMISAQKKTETDFLSATDLEIMEYVWKRFGAKSSQELVDYSHKFPEWTRYENNLTNKQMPNAYDIVIQDMFESVEGEDFSELFDKELSMMSRDDFQAHHAFKAQLLT